MSRSSARPPTGGGRRPGRAGPFTVGPEALGSADFRRDHGVRYAYVAGSLYRAVASEDMVIRMSRAGLLGYFGAGGLRLNRVETALERLGRTLGPGRPYGLHLAPGPSTERHLVELLLRHDVRWIEAASYTQLTPSLVRYRVRGLTRRPDGSVVARHKVLAKVSQPQVATAFLRPPPEHLVRQLVADGDLTIDEAELARSVPMADDLCAEADPGSAAAQRPIIVLLPEMVRLRDRIGEENRYPRPVRVGVAGGIGTPESVAAAFVLGADFVLTDTINQCTVEAGTTDEGKDRLQQNRVRDPGREPGSVPSSPKDLRRAFGRLWEEARESYQRTDPDEVEKAERDPRYKMGLVLRWHFMQPSGDRAGPGGDPPVAAGPAIGSLNNYLRGTPLEDWRSRHVDDLAELLMSQAAELLSRRLLQLAGFHSEEHSAPPRVTFP